MSCFTTGCDAQTLFVNMQRFEQQDSSLCRKNDMQFAVVQLRCCFFCSHTKKGSFFFKSSGECAGPRAAIPAGL